MKRTTVYSIELVKEKTVLYEEEGTKVVNPEEVAKIFESAFNMSRLNREIVVMMALNNKNVVVGLHMLSMGTVNNSLIHPSEIFKFALLLNASSYVIAHNHPSGVVEPSGEDLVLTRRLMDASNIMGIKILDHLVIGHDTRNDMMYYSIKANNDVDGL